MNGGTRTARGGREGGGRWLRHMTFPQCIEGTGLSVTHTVGVGRGGEREQEKGRGREKERRRGRG